MLGERERVWYKRGRREAKSGDHDNQVTIEIEERGIYFRKPRHCGKPFFFTYFIF